MMMMMSVADGDRWHFKIVIHCCDIRQCQFQSGCGSLL